MFLSNAPRIEELIAHALAKKPNQSAQDLLIAVRKLRGPASLPSIYQALRKLERDGVVRRYNHRYSLGLDWVMDLVGFADRLYDRYTQDDVVGFLPLHGEKLKKWRFYSIATAVPFWTHLVLCMVHASEMRQCHEYVDHVWFHLVSSTVEVRLIKAIQDMQVKHYLCVGSNTLLDRAYQREVDFGGMHLEFGVKPLDAENYLSCVGPYILRLQLKADALRRIENFYSNSSNSDLPRATDIGEFVHERTSIGLSVEYNSRRADSIRRAFLPFIPA
jgi:hypothetical protein